MVHSPRDGDVHEDVPPLFGVLLDAFELGEHDDFALEPFTPSSNYIVSRSALIPA
jgi:hypothetical protein